MSYACAARVRPARNASAKPNSNALCSFRSPALQGRPAKRCSRFVEPLPSSVTSAVRFLHSDVLIAFKQSHRFFHRIFFSMKFSRYVADPVCRIRFWAYALCSPLSRRRFPGGHLLSRSVSRQVSSADCGLTVVFGMGTGVSHSRIVTGNFCSFSRRPSPAPLTTQ